MKLRKSILLLLVLTLALGTALAACGGNDDVDTEPTETDGDTEETTSEEPATSEPTEGGTVTLSMYSAPAGVYNPIVYTDAYERNVFRFIFEGLVNLDTNLSWEPELAKDWYFENDNTTLVMELRDDVLWHDGEQFTADDVVYTYSSIAHPDYTGPRTNYVTNMVGFEEYRAGDVDEFAGVEADGDYVVKFHFKEPRVLALFDASFSIIPEHVYSQYPVGELEDVSETLDWNLLIGTGPFKATDDWLSGEYYTLERNEDYWKGSPKIDNVVWRIVNQDVAPGMLANGEIDIITTPTGVRASDYEFVSGIDGVTIYETPTFGYQYLGLKLHHRTPEDVDNSVYNPDNWIPNEKLHSVELRQAIAYAIDRQGIVDGLLEGHGTVMHAPFPPASWAYDASVVNDYAHSPEKAEELLDAAGFEDVDGDGFREDLNGDPLVLRLDYPTGNRVRELSAPIIEEQLEAVGLNIDLRAPREAGSHFDAIDEDEEGMDMYLAGWSLSEADPDPFGIWGITDVYNYNRWNDEHSEQLLNDAVKPPEAFDQDYRMEKYQEWASYINEQLPSVFLYAANDIYAWNSKIQGIIEGPDHIFRDMQDWYIAE